MMEGEAVVVELAERLGVPMPNTRTVYACTRLLNYTFLQKETTQ